MQNEECRVEDTQTSANDRLKLRTYVLARRIVKLVLAMPRITVGNVLGKQVLRSGTSIGANYREAMRARSRAEFVAKLGDCLKEAEETSFWLELIMDESVIPPARVSDLRDEVGEITAMLVASINSARRNGTQSGYNSAL